MTIFDLFEGLARCAPGDADALARAVALAGTPQGSHVLDAGCGTGGDLAALAAVIPGARITALDLSAQFVAQVQAAHPDVRAVCGDMLAPPPGPYDLIWSNGAAYAVGIAQALNAWRPVLAAGGRVILTDLVLRDADAPEVRAFFAAEGLDLAGLEAMEAAIQGAGWRVLDGFWLPDAAWAAYYLPLEARLDSLGPQTSPDMADLIAGFRAEIDLWRRHGARYGYYLCIAEPAP